MSIAAQAQRALWLSPAEMPARPGHIPSLDGLRAVSIMLVMLGHFVSPKVPGGLGVLIFFVISGFLIARLLLAEYKTTGTISLPSFYGRRFLRLYPVIVVFTAVIVGLSLVRGYPVNLVEPLSALLYFANYLYSSFSLPGARAGEMPFSIFWSLSVEEHFYIIFPPLLLMLGLRPVRLVLVLVAVLVACLLSRTIVALLHPEYLGTHFFYFRTEFRLDSLAIGVLVAVLCESEPGRRVLTWLTRPAAVGAGLATVFACLILRDPFFRETLRYTLLNVAVATLIVAVVFSGRYAIVARVLNSGPAVWIGRISYSIYVWHLVVAMILKAGEWASGWALVLVEFGGTLVLAAASYYLVEQPFVGLRHRLRGRAPRPVVPAQSDPARVA